MIIKVTEQDIKNGRKESEFTCPVALAVKRELGLKRLSRKIQVWGTSITVSDVGTIYVPDKVGTFVENFDDGARVQPFKFRMRNPFRGKK